MTKTKTPQKLKLVTYEITLPKGVEVVWVTMLDKSLKKIAGKLYYLADTTGEAIAEGGVSAPAKKLTAIWLGWSDKSQKWVYGVSWDNGDVDRIEYNGALPNMPTLTELQAAVVSVAWEHGAAIREDQVNVNGGNIYACWDERVSPSSECTTQN